MYYNDIEVYGARLVVAKQKDEVILISGRYTDVANVETDPLITLDQAIEIACNKINAESYYWQNNNDSNSPNYVLELYSKDSTNLRLSYGMIIGCYKSDYDEREIFIDAINGDVLFNESVLYFANGIAETRYSGRQNISTKQENNGYILLEDGSCRASIHTRNFINCTTNDTTYSEFVDNDNHWSAAEYNNNDKDWAALDAHWGMEMTYDYFRNIHNRMSYDNRNSPILLNIHVNMVQNGIISSNDNACYRAHNNQFYFGDGQSRFSPLVSLDIIAHEFAHAVTYHSTRLDYSGESGAINEALSDIYGACVKNYVNLGKNIWMNGIETLLDTTNTSILRSLSNPKQCNTPDTYLGQYWYNLSSNYTENLTFVHKNSTVISHWFYILCNGKQGINDNGFHYNVKGIGFQKAEKKLYI